MIDSKNVLIVIPALNEAETIESVVKEVLDAGYSILVVSDGSTDATAIAARSAGARTLQLPINLGVGGALRAGFKHAMTEGFEAVVQVDADGQHPVDEIRNLIDAANREKAHLVIGSRFRSMRSTMDVHWTRRLAMRVLSTSASRAVGTRITDATSGFRIIAQPLLEQFAASFPSYYLGDTYEAVVSAGRAGYVVREIPAAIKAREFGESSASTGQALRFTVKSFALVLLRIHFPIVRHNC
jgi:glycosyltransferase involved in cell wall biosynthesis